MEKVNTTTPSILDENVERLAKLFPEVVTEVRETDGTLRHTIDVDALKERVGDVAEDGRERYQFTWPGKRESKQEAYRIIDKCFRPCPGQSVNWDTTENLYIEGDNLDALKLLRNTYAGKIKMIYIDPPYNTGHDFIYDDDFKQSRDEYDADNGDYDEEGGRLVANPESNGRFHSDWCSMMYPRLLLARDLLSEDGFLFLSIDDREVFNVRKMLTEVFGDQSFIAQVIAISNPGGRDYDQVAIMHEYVIILQKTMGILSELPSDTKFKTFDKMGGYTARELRNRNPKFNRANRPNLFYPFYANPNETDKYGYCSVRLIPDENHTIEILPKNAKGADSCWRWGKEKASHAIAETVCDSEVVAKQVTTGKWNVYEKSRRTTSKAKSLWNETEMRTEDGTREINRLFPENPRIFDHPKSVQLVKRCCRLATDKSSLILDFFSGSATTAHAVMKLNAEDGGNRRFIMVQLPEVCEEGSEAAKAGYKNICEIGEERIRRAGKKIAAEIEEENKNLKPSEIAKRVPDIGFRVFKIDSSNFEDVKAEPSAYHQQALLGLVDNLKDGRTEEDILFQVLPQFQIPLSAPIEALDIDGSKVFSVDEGRLVACFDKQVSTACITEMAKMNPDYAVMRDASFTSDDAVSNFNELFKIYSPATITRVI